MKRCGWCCVCVWKNVYFEFHPLGTMSRHSTNEVPFSRSSEGNNGVSISERYKRFNRLAAVELRFCDFNNVVECRRVSENKIVSNSKCLSCSPRSKISSNSPTTRTTNGMVRSYCYTDEGSGENQDYDQHFSACHFYLMGKSTRILKDGSKR